MDPEYEVVGVGPFPDGHTSQRGERKKQRRPSAFRNPAGPPSEREVLIR